MNSCCSVPIKMIEEDRHKPDGECSLITDISDAPTRAECPISGKISSKIQKRTLEHLLIDERLTLLRDRQYYYCYDPDCHVVYFPYGKGEYFTRRDLKVKVYSKDPGGDVNVCYCFDWSRDRIKKEFEETGKSTAAKQIAREVKAGNCRCDIKNPKGRCCLGDVNLEVKKYSSQIQEGM
jgi:hypothetical protein